MIKRFNTPDKTHLLIKTLDEIIQYKKEDFLKEFGVSGIIKLNKKYYNEIIKKPKVLNHFYINLTNSYVNQIVMPLLILESGYYNSDVDYRIPLLEKVMDIKYKVVEVGNNISIDEIDNFKNTVDWITDKESLLNELFSLYKISNPSLSKNEIKVAYTKLLLL